MFLAPDRAQPTDRPRSGNFGGFCASRGHFQVKKSRHTYDSVWTKVGLLVELYTNPPSDLYNSIMLLHNSNSKFEALGPKSTGCTVYYPRGGGWTRGGSGPQSSFGARAGALVYTCHTTSLVTKGWLVVKACSGTTSPPKLVVITTSPLQAPCSRSAKSSKYKKLVLEACSGVRYKLPFF